MPTAEPERPRPAPPAPDWRRIRGTVFPILLMFVLLFVVGRMHLDLAHGFTAPRVVSDGEQALVFYDEGARDSAFYTRRTHDGVAFTKPERVSGVLEAACITSDLLVTLNGDPGDADDGWFYSVFSRGQKPERLWSGTFKDPELGLTRPRHVAALGERVFVFGTDPSGTLRAAELSHDRNLVPVKASLAGAGVPPKPASSETASRRAKRSLHEVSSVVCPDGLVLMWRVPQELGGDINGPGEVRWTRFDGTSFGPLQTFPADLQAYTLVAGQPGLEGIPDPGVLGVLQGDEEDVIRIYALEGTSPAEVGKVPYEREGLTGSAGIASLAAGRVRDRLLLLAQIGGVIRYASLQGSQWSEWQDLARAPPEQRAVVYGWCLSLLFLSGLLVIQGWRGYRIRRARLRARKPAPSLEAYCAPVLDPSPPPAPETPPPRREPAPPAGPPEPAAPLVERLVAFLIDLGVVLLICSLLLSLAPRVLYRAEDDPRARLALAAWFLVALVAYFILLETAFARTVGKRLLGLEVQLVNGGKPSLEACLYRNLFRVELVLPPTQLVAPLSLMVMVFSVYHQRPGDMLAHTCVRRSGPAGGTA